MSIAKDAVDAFKRQKMARINNKWLVEIGQLIMRHVVHEDIAASNTWVTVIANGLDQVIEDYEQHFKQVYNAKVNLDDLSVYLAPETLARINKNQLALLKHSIGKEADAVLGGLEQQVQILTSLRDAFRTAGAGSLAKIDLRMKLLQGIDVTAEDVEGGLAK